MATDITPYTSLKTIATYALDELDKGVADMDKCWLLALRCMSSLTFDVMGQTITVRLPVLPNKTVPFPSDMISWSKIGLVDDKGQINTLKVNNALTTFRDNNPNRLQDLTPDINNSIGNLALIPYYSNYYYGGGCFQLYGVGNGVITYGECKVDEVNRVILLDPEFKYDDILLEFLSAPQLNGEYQVPTCMQEAVIAFIKWKLKLGSREEYFAAVTMGRRSLPKKKVILQTLNQVLRESDGMKLRS
jgi:hypothetical protein